MSNIFKQNFSVDREKLNLLNGHKSFLIWFTGLSGSGKSTIADALQDSFHKEGMHTYLLDGDNLRLGLNHDLGFSKEDRSENLRRTAEIAKIMIDAGLLTIASFVSPLIKDREQVKAIVGQDDFIEIFINTSIEECEKRDVKGLYSKAKMGEIDNFTGISSPYEFPENPDLEIRTEETSIEQAVEAIRELVCEKLAL